MRIASQEDGQLYSNTGQFIFLIYYYTGHTYTDQFVQVKEIEKTNQMGGKVVLFSKE
jgi:hypothetical protein